MSVSHATCRFLLFSIIQFSLSILFIIQIFPYNFFESFLSPTILTHSWRRSLLHRNHSIDLLCELTDWFLYDRDYHHERVKHSSDIIRMRILNPLRDWYFYSSGRNALSKRTANKKKLCKIRKWSWTSGRVKSAIWRKK